ncbi:MAG: protein imuB [Caulobacteraceae bacterium]|nr:protein imuB [Caulobacteraceae bacterium]
MALVQAERGVRRLYAVDAGAAALGLFVGQKATDAAALVPELVLDDADPATDAAALTALADWCARFSPAVALDPPGGLFLDITGVAHLWGGERTMAADLTARLARNGLAVRTAIAGTPGSAWALAHFGEPGGAVLAPGGERAVLAPLPAAALRLAPEEAAQIVRLGLSTVGSLAALPRDQVTRRFGPGVVLRLDQALGQVREALTFRRPPTPWFARLAFAEPISVPEDLARAARDIAERLCVRLEAEGRGARRFELCFHRLDGAVHRLIVGLALPGRHAGVIARLLIPKLETVDPGFGIEVVTLAADGVEPLSARQGRLDEDRDVALEEGVAPLVDRLTNRLGEDAVWRAEPFPSHDPERAVQRRPPLSPAAGSSPGSPSGSGWDPARPRPLRLFRRPEPIEAMAPVPDDPPVFFRWRGAGHRVRRAEGPERLAEEWWRHPFEDDEPGRVRDYYRVEDETGARFWVFRDGLYAPDTHPRWWLHGLFG